MYYKGTEKKCLDILERLDNYLGYPNNDSKTLTTSSVGFVSETEEYFICVPKEAETVLTKAEKSALIDDRPIEFNVVD
tara:strand:- start:237 stop:470 length:234 start_codon:yes stop_codon:yes gene_type:complete